MSDHRELLRRMLDLYSPTGEEEAVSQLLVDTFRAAGLHAEQDEAGNFVGSVWNGPAEVVLLGHIDTVPGVVPVREGDGRMYGRGAVDAKGPMATFVSAALRLAEEGMPPGLKLTLIGAAGEEGDSRGAWHIVDRYRPQGLVIGEPGGWDSVVLGYKGSLRVCYRLTRPSSHSAGPGEAVAEEAVRFWQELKGLADGYNEDRRVFDQLSPSLRSINTTSDGLADRVEMELNVRLPLGYGPEELEERLRGATGDATVEVYFGQPAVRGEKNTHLVRAFLAGIRAHGARPRFKVKTGTSDMNVVGPVWGCPMLAYGPGDSSLDHTPEEHIELAEYDRAIDVLVSALKNLGEAS